MLYPASAIEAVHTHRFGLFMGFDNGKNIDSHESHILSETPTKLVLKLK